MLPCPRLSLLPEKQGKHNWASISIILSRKRTAKMLIRLCGCADWSVPSLFTYGKNGFSHDAAQMSLSTTKQTKWPVGPLKIQISLGILPVWSAFTVWSESARRMSFCWFFLLRLILCKLFPQHYLIYEPGHEKMCLTHMRTTKVQISLRIC